MSNEEKLGAEAIREIGRLTLTASEVKLATLPGEPHKYVLFQGGKYELRDKPAPDRNHVVHTLDEFIKAAIYYHSEVVWITGNSVIGVLDDDDDSPTRHRDFVSLKLSASSQFESLADLEGAGVFEQRKLVYWLKHDMNGCVSNEQIISIISSMDFARSNSGASTVAHGKESLGRSVENVAKSSIGEIPEIFVLDIPVYTNAGEERSFPVRCSIWIDTDTARLTVRPLPGELHKAENASAAWIQERLKSAFADSDARIVPSAEPIPVFLGNFESDR